MIYYIGFYDENISKENRFKTLSATNKMNYIIESIVENQEEVKIISPSWTNNSEFYPKKNKKIKDNVYLKMPSTIPWKGKILKILSMAYSNLWLFFYLLFKIRKNEKVIVYHSLYLMIPIILARKFKQFELILELEEKYQDVKKIPKVLQKCEELIIWNSDKYILATKLLEKEINPSKRYIVCNGTYKAEKKIAEKFEDGKIHIVYSGVIDKIKKGAFTAADIGLYLDEKYCVHILGFGKLEDIKELKEKIDLNIKKTKCRIQYDGLLKGEEYNRFLQKCYIGLSTQNPNEKYNSTSFPSKILTYLANGLRVVSIKIEAINTSEVGNLIDYYEEDNPKKIAEVIKSIDLTEKYDSRKAIQRLHKEFLIQIKELINY